MTATGSAGPPTGRRLVLDVPSTGQDLSSYIRMGAAGGDGDGPDGIVLATDGHHAERIAGSVERRHRKTFALLVRTEGLERTVDGSAAVTVEADDVTAVASADVVLTSRQGKIVFTTPATLFRIQDSYLKFVERIKTKTIEGISAKAIILISFKFSIVGVTLEAAGYFSYKTYSIKFALATLSVTGLKLSVGGSSKTIGSKLGIKFFDSKTDLLDEEFCVAKYETKVHRFEIRTSLVDMVRVLKNPNKVIEEEQTASLFQKAFGDMEL